MVTYCFTTDDGVTVDREFPRGEAPEFVITFKHDTPLYVRLTDAQIKKYQVKAYRDYRAEGVTGTVVGTKTKTQGWPQTCFASGVHPNQANELREHLARRGCSTEVKPSGDPVYTSAAHKKKALKIRGMRDKSSFC